MRLTSLAPRVALASLAILLVSPRLPAQATWPGTSWETIAPALSEIDYTPYPVASRVGPIVGELYGLGDPERSFNFGLELLLDGFERLIASKGKVDATPASA